MLKWIKSILVFAGLSVPSLYAVAQKTGGFEGHNDIGAVLHRGAFSYNPRNRSYTITGSGSNVWFNHDELHFAWNKMRGDFILQARARFSGRGTNPHRKTGWMIRSSQDTNSAMVSATIHGDGLAALQYRNRPGEPVQEVRSAIKAPDVIQLEKRGTRFIMSVARYGDPYSTEQIADLDLGNEVYAGLYICAHDKEVKETAAFDNVRIIVPAKENFVPYRDYIGSLVETMDIASGKREIIYTSPASLQAPNWTKNGKSLVYNSSGLIYLLDLRQRKPRLLPTGTVKNNNNDHVISFDGKMLGLSSSSPDGRYNSVVYTVPLRGGQPVQVTPVGPSYLHGWSPDGKYLVYTAQRQNEFDIYRIPSGGGTEVRLTTSPGLDDGPEYSPDGRYIYYNSVRSGTMQIWRMNSDGTGQVQITGDEYNNWFPHVSPDGRWIVFLSFMKEVSPEDHPFYRQVYLRLIPAGGGKPRVIAYLYGGQGSINTPSWSPDSKKIAFVGNSQMNNE